MEEQHAATPQGLGQAPASGLEGTAMPPAGAGGAVTRPAHHPFSVLIARPSSQNPILTCSPGQCPQSSRQLLSKPEHGIAGA